MKKKISISSVVAVVLIVVLAIINQRNKAEAARKSNEEFLKKLDRYRHQDSLYFEYLKKH